MAIADKLITINENMPKVYDAGKQAEYDRFWNIIQNHGKRNAYQSAFCWWDCEYIRPVYKVVPTTGHMAQMFYGNKSLKKIEAEYFDFSQVPAASYASNGLYYTFQFCTALEEIEDVNLPGDFLTGTFHGCSKLHTIAKLNVKESTTFASNPFYDCTALEEIRFEGVIGKSLNLGYSTKLSAESYEIIFECMTVTVSGQTLTVPSTAEAIYNAKYNSGAWQTKVDEKKALGWAVSYL